MTFLKNIEKISGFAVFIFTLTVYISCISIHASFWDSGELISAAYKLQVPHPPGSPLYLIIARFFSIFAFSPTNVTIAVSLLSSVAAALTVYFLFRIIFQLCSSLLIDGNNKLIAVFSAVIGSLSLAFSESFWTSAIEAEVYSLSAFFVTFTFWAVIKCFETTAIIKQQRFILLISLLIGLSATVHFLNLLIIPAIVLYYFFNKYKFSLKGFLTAIICAIGLLFIVFISITGIPRVLSVFELFTVNLLGFSYNSGLFLFIIIIIVLFTVLVLRTHNKKNTKANLIIISILLFLSGYSTYSLIIIRSSQNLPINEVSPDNIFSFIEYISRDQYESAPLIYGPTYASRIDKRKPFQKGQRQYRKLDGQYEVVAHKPEENHRKSDKILFPRMWSKEALHIAAYKEWGKVGDSKKPGYLNNLRFLSTYQISHMYLRYLFWNFSGKQNDLQGHGGPVRGNWISGMKSLDNFRLGIKHDMPRQYTHASKSFYLIPLLLGFIGFIFIYFKNKKIFIVSLTLFLFTGIAIVLYLNQYPYQVRERDYSYLASFMVFSLWIGFGFTAICILIKRYFSKPISIFSLFMIFTIAVPGQMLVKNFKYISKSGDNFVFNFAYNYLNSCEKDAILFTSGDNETFPLWYLQNVYGIRTDIKIINLAFLNFDWYINQIKMKTYDAKGLPIIIPRTKYFPGQRDILLYKDNVYAFVEEIFLANHLEINQHYHILLNTFLNMLNESGFKDKHPNDFEAIAYHYFNIKPHGGDEGFRHFGKIINDLQKEEYRNELMLNKTQADELRILLEKFLSKQLSYHVPLDAVLRFIFSNDESTRITSNIYEYSIDYLPVKKLLIDVSVDDFINKNPEFKDYADFIVDKMLWEINNESIGKAHLMLFEIIRSNKWERPLYFSSTMPSDNYLGLDNYLFQEGWTYRLLPINYENSNPERINVNAKIMYENLTKEFLYNHIISEKYYDELRRSLLYRERQMYAKLAEALYYDGEIEKSKEILDKCLELFSDQIIPYDYFMLDIIKGYYRLGRKSIAREISEVLISNIISELEFYMSFEKRQFRTMDLQIKKALSTLQELHNLADEFKHIEIKPVLQKHFENYFSLYLQKNNQNL